VWALGRDRALLEAGRRLRLWLLPLGLALVRGHAGCTWPAPPNGTLRAAILAPADHREREVALRLLPIALRGGEALVCAGSDFEQAVGKQLGAQVLRPNAAESHLSSIRQRVESVFWTLKGPARTRAPPGTHAAGIRARIAGKLLALAAGVWLNHLLGCPTRAFADLAT
jgi:hypothetical protein